MAASNPTGYQQRLHFDADHFKYQLWETKFLGHMRHQKIYGLFRGTVEPNQANKALESAQLIQYLYDRSLSLIMRDAPNDGPKSLKILNENYMGKGEPCIIYLYT